MEIQTRIRDIWREILHWDFHSCVVSQSDWHAVAQQLEEKAGISRL